MEAISEKIRYSLSYRIRDTARQQEAASQRENDDTHVEVERRSHDCWRVPRVSDGSPMIYHAVVENDGSLLAGK
jgi:hypothetical protein